MTARHVVFVAPFFMAATLRFVAAAAELPGVHLSLVSSDPAERLPAALRQRLSGHWRVADCFDARQLVQAARELGRRVAPVERLIGSLEQLQVPLAEARESLGLPGIGAQVARNFRDKNRMKGLFERAGVPCARHRLAGDRESVKTFVRETGLPIVVKPPTGAGARNTFRLADERQLEAWLASRELDPQRPALLEEFLAGEEFSFDSVMLGGRLVWHSISSYRPSPLTVLENPWIQWCVILPREIGGPEFDPIRRAAPHALAALGLDTGLTHMEWFRRADGTIAISEVAIRPPGAQFTTLLSFAHDLDFYSAWPRLAIFDDFDPPQRHWATGAVYLRGMGQGRVVAIEGVDALQARWGSLVVEASLPRAGEPQPEGYEGVGYVIFRHEQTGPVEDALRDAVRILRVRLAD